MKKNYSGPFFKKTSEGLELADFCKDCAFGDEEGCLLNPCIHFQYTEETEKTERDPDA